MFGFFALEKSMGLKDIRRRQVEKFARAVKCYCNLAILFNSQLLDSNLFHCSLQLLTKFLCHGLLAVLILGIKAQIFRDAAQNLVKEFKVDISDFLQQISKLFERRSTGTLHLAFVEIVDALHGWGCQCRCSVVSREGPHGTGFTGRARSFALSSFLTGQLTCNLGPSDFALKSQPPMNCFPSSLTSVHDPVLHPGIAWKVSQSYAFFWGQQAHHFAVS